MKVKTNYRKLPTVILAVGALLCLTSTASAFFDTFPPIRVVVPPTVNDINEPPVIPPGGTPPVEPPVNPPVEPPVVPPIMPPVHSTPEPATLIMGLSAMSIAGAFARRRKS